MKKITEILLIGSLFLMAACNKNSPPAATIFHPQFVFNSRGDLLLEWCEEHEFGANLFLAHLDNKNQISIPTRINHIPGMVNASPFDELRPAFAVGADGLLAVGFTDTNWDVRVSLSRDDGQAFLPAIKLNQDTTRAMQSFVSVALDAAGGLHGVWLDPREAPPGQEEPCDLYYAFIKDDIAHEINLTTMQTVSVCGCCRPNISFRNENTLEVVFRNTNASGYRDIFKMTKNGANEFSPPTRLGPPLWKIAGCPAAGPIVINEWTLWNDGSTGAMRLLAIADGKPAPEPLLISDESWTLNGSPRPVKTNDRTAAFILAPGSPNGRLLHLENTSWRVSSEDIPEWCRDAAFANGQLHLVGSIDGKLKLESRPTNF